MEKEKRESFGEKTIWRKLFGRRENSCRRTEQSGIKGIIGTAENKQVVTTPAICYMHWEQYKHHSLPQMLFCGIQSHLFVGAPRARLWSTL